MTTETYTLSGGETVESLMSEVEAFVSNISDPQYLVDNASNLETTINKLDALNELLPSSEYKERNRAAMQVAKSMASQVVANASSIAGRI